MSNIISTLFGNSHYNEEVYDDFKNFIDIIKLIDVNSIEMEGSFFGFEDDVKKNSFLIQICSKGNLHIPIKIEIDFIYKTCFYTIGKNQPVEQTFGQSDVDLNIVFTLFKKYLTTDHRETAYYSKNHDLVKGYYSSSKEAGQMKWYKWSFSFNRLKKEENFYNRWI